MKWTSIHIGLPNLNEQVLIYDVYRQYIGLGIMYDSNTWITISTEHTEGSLKPYYWRCLPEFPKE